MLDNLSDKLQSIFSGLRSKGKLNEDDINSAMKEIRMALLEADVNFKVVKSFIKNAKGTLPRCRSARFAHASAERHQGGARPINEAPW